MDYFPTLDMSPAALCIAMLARADVYVGIIGLDFGSPVPGSPELSYTQLEFSTATERGMPRLIFLLDEQSSLVPRTPAHSANAARQAAFRRQLQEYDLTVATVATPAELELRLYQSLVELLGRPNWPSRGPLVLPKWSSDDATMVARAREDLLHQVDEYWIRTELEQSLSELARIELGLVEHPAAVTHPLQTMLRQPPLPDRPVPKEETIDMVFRARGRQLAILGEPGAGKTTLLLELARALLVDAMDDLTARMPVVFHLSTWSPRHPNLAVWLVDELQRRYGVARWLGQLWLDRDEVIPLLDGLDEVSPRYRDACLTGINTFHREHGQLPLAVCSRTAEYASLATRLELRTAVVISPLQRDDVERYVRGAGSVLGGLLAALHEDEVLADLLTTPLLLTVAALTYRSRPAAVTGVDTLERRRTLVLADYVDEMLTRPRASAAPYSRTQTLSWLRWLAVTMRAHGQSIFYLDLIQPDWLPMVAQRYLVTLGVPLAAGLVSGMLTAAIIVSDRSQMAGSTPLLAFVLIVSLTQVFAFAVSVFQPGINPPEQLNWSWIKLRRNVVSKCLNGVAAGLALGLSLGSMDGLVTAAGWVAAGGNLSAAAAPSLRNGLFVFGIVLGVCMGVGAIVALTSGIDERYAIDPPTVGHGLRVSLRSWIVSTLTLGLGSGVLYAIAAQRLMVMVLDSYHSLLQSGNVAQARFTALLPLALATGLVGGVGIGLLIRLGILRDRPQQLRRGLLMALAVSALFGPAQWVASRGMAILGIRIDFLLVHGVSDVPAWPLTGLIAGLIVASGGSVRVAGIVSAINSLTGGVFLPDQDSAVALFSVYSPSAVAGLTVGISAAVGMRHGGGAYLRHWMLRLLLAQRDLAPLSYAPFLDHAARLNLLRRRGGGYEFVHRLVLEYLADASKPDHESRPNRM